MDMTQQAFKIDLENKKNQKIGFNNILQIETKEKVWGNVLFLDVMEGWERTEVPVFCCTGLGKIST